MAAHVLFVFFSGQLSPSGTESRLASQVFYGFTEAWEEAGLPLLDPLILSAESPGVGRIFAAPQSRACSLSCPPPSYFLLGLNTL